jgi:tripeptidyl-peptidase-1
METIATVRSWLKDEGVSSNRIKLSAGLDWIEFNATVGEAERLFMAG